MKINLAACRLDRAALHGHRHPSRIVEHAEQSPGVQLHVGFLLGMPLDAHHCPRILGLHVDCCGCEGSGRRTCTIHTVMSTLWHAHVLMSIRQGPAVYSSVLYRAL